MDVIHATKENYKEVLPEGPQRAFEKMMNAKNPVSEAWYCTSSLGEKTLRKKPPKEEAKSLEEQLDAIECVENTREKWNLYFEAAERTKSNSWRR